MAKMKPVGDLMLYWKIGEDAADVKGRLVLKENKLEKDKQTKQVGVDDEKNTQQQKTNSKVRHELADPISKKFRSKGCTITTEMHGSAVTHSRDAHQCD